MGITGIKGVIFDLDGVIVTTEDCHFAAWKQMADEQHIYFDRAISERLCGVPPMDGLDIVLEQASREYDLGEKMALATRQNDLYLETIAGLGPDDILPGVVENLRRLREHGIKIAVASASTNMAAILNYIGMKNYFDAMVDGNQISRLKPDPQVLHRAAQGLGFAPAQCLAVENTDAGIEAAFAVGMASLGVGLAPGNKKATAAAPSLLDIDIWEWVKPST